MAKLSERLLGMGVQTQIRANEFTNKSEVDIEEGSTTVEYAIGAIATAGFAGLLIAVLKSGGVKSLITNIIQSALSI